MLQTVDVGEQPLATYSGVAPEATLAAVADYAEDLRGARVLHLNSTPFGGGVSELLRSVVPLLNDLGLIADWKIISGDDAFFRVTKAIHNGLQGSEHGLTPQEQAAYRATSERNATRLEEEYDFIFVHDPQPAAILPFHGKGRARWVWRCHIDTAQPNPDVWAFIRQFLPDYDATVFTMPEFVPPDLPIDRLEIIPPAIDPLSPKNLELDTHTATEILDWIGVTTNHPLITQVSRFDRWKDPHGVIDAYERVRESLPDLQLALVGSMATDDPEGWEIYNGIVEASAADPLIHVFTNLVGIGNIEVNAFQMLSDVVVQKSLREGFGLVVSEALWKGTPVVAGNAGGIPLQLADGAGGVLVDTVGECADAVLDLLREPQRAAELGQRGKERVRELFLLPRLVLNELSLMRELTGARPFEARPGRAGMWRDPVCGMAIGPDAEQIATTHSGVKYVFCSRACRTRFRRSPARYVSTTR